MIKKTFAFAIPGVAYQRDDHEMDPTYECQPESLLSDHL